MGFPSSIVDVLGTPDSGVGCEPNTELAGREIAGLETSLVPSVCSGSVAFSEEAPSPNIPNQSCITPPAPVELGDCTLDNSAVFSSKSPDEGGRVENNPGSFGSLSSAPTPFLSLGATSNWS